MSKIDEFFPLEEYRPLQRETIQRIVDLIEEGTKYILLEAPTGSGKSAIGFTIAQLYSPAYYLAPQKFLQDQLTKDFGQTGKYTGQLMPMIDLKGRNAYPCTYYEKVVNGEYKAGDKQMAEYKALAKQEIKCDIGECKKQGETKLAECDGYCPYFNRLDEAVTSEICLMNFHSFLYQSTFTKRFNKRKIMFLDESHNVEDFLMKFVEVNVSDKPFMKQGIKFPELDNVEKYIKYFNDIQLLDLINTEIRMARLMLNVIEEEEYTRLATKIRILLDADPSKWVCEWKERKDNASRSVVLKPIFVDEFAHKYLYPWADHFIMMSATILSKTVMCDALGMPKDETKMLRLPSNFPKDIRPIFYTPSGAMSYNMKQATFPKLIADVNRICRENENLRGMIHTHNFEIASKIMEECASDVRRRFLHQHNPEFKGDKSLLLARHKNINDSVIVAPAMHEGLDLKDDLGRFQIICKVPYPSKGDPQIAARMEISPEYYEWRTATKLVQSYGRIHRHDTDWGKTYVLDENFKMFVKMSKKLFPKWFLEAIIW